MSRFSHFASRSRGSEASPLALLPRAAAYDVYLVQFVDGLNPARVPF